MIRRWILCGVALAGIACAKQHQFTDTSNTVLTLASSRPQVVTFITMVQTSGVDATLRAKDPVTVLAPTNGALDVLGTDKIRYLMSPEGATELDEFVKHYIFPGSFSAEDIARGKLSPSLAGKKITTAKAPDGTPRVEGTGKILWSMEGSNGFAHVIDTMLP